METLTKSIYTCLRNWTLKLVLYPSCAYLIGFQYFIWSGTDTNRSRLDRPDNGTVTLITMHSQPSVKA